MGTSRRHPQVINVDEMAPDQQAQGLFAFKRRRLGPEAGARALGCTYFELAPGHTSFPYHFHSAFEEAIFVVEGSASARIGKDRVDVRAGDYIAFPAGPDSAHALTNTGTGTLRYLCVSGSAAPTTMDIVGYPDSKKFAFASGVDPIKGFRGGAWVMKVVKDDSPAVGYYDDEPLAQRK